MAQTNGYQIDLSNLIYHANVNTDSIVPTRELIVRRVFCFFGGDGALDRSRVDWSAVPNRN